MKGLEKTENLKGVRTHQSRFLIAVAVAACLLGVLSVEGWAVSVEEVVARAQDRYDRTADIRAEFVQESTIQSIGKTEKEEGVFYFKYPSRMVWDYSQPKAKKLIINPTTSWLYIPADRMVYVQDSSSLLRSKVIVRLISGLGKLQDDFQVSFGSPDGLDQSGNYLLKLKPREEDLGIREFLLSLHRDLFYITQLSFADSLGNRTRLFFRNITTNNRLPETLFTFKPPPGTEVYTNK